MKIQTHRNRIIHGALMLTALLGAIFMAPALRAQPATRKVDNRFLLVFDTSAEMKRRLAAVQKTLNLILATSVNGQLHSNDSIGVWTFDQELQTGQFPLQRWKPDNAVMIASNINAFVGSRRYSKKTGFEALVPLLNQVAHRSERLTVVIFCDGNGELHGTPYDTGINQVFQQRQGERQKARLPIVIVLHSQLGEYIDCVVSFPPQPVSFPEFPPLPEPAPPQVEKAPAPRPKVPPLIIIGTPPTNRAPPPVPKPAPTNPPLMTATSTPAPAVISEVRPPEVAPSMPTGAVPAQLKIAPALLPGTNANTVSAESTGISRTEAFAMGAGFLVVAVGLSALLFRRGRKTGGDSGSPVG
jgi:hypothetical protein